jgi:hypothetical protein
MSMYDDLFAVKESGNFDVSDHKGKLALFTPTEYKDSIKTKFNESGTDAVVTDVVVFDEDGEAEEFTDAMIFQARLKGDLRKRIGSRTPMRLARLNTLPKGSSVKYPQSEPWAFLDPSDEDRATATAYLKRVEAERKAKDDAEAPF